MHLRQTPSIVRAVLVLILLSGLIMAGCGDAADGLTVGDPAPTFVLPTASGSTVALDDYAGGPALLYFHMADG